ncbi:putative RNA-directed DNA polymerase [Tanacetum coccineum]
MMKRGDTPNEEGNRRVASDDCDITVEDEAATITTQIWENVTFGGNVHDNQNGDGPTNFLEASLVLRRSSRQRNLPSKLNNFVVGSSVRYVLSGSLSKSKLVEAMNLKMEAVHRNNTYVLVDLPPRRKAIGCKWIWKIKYKSSREVDRYKARLVANGYSQREDIDYDETFSPVVKMVIIRCLIALSVQNNWPLYQLDVNNAFLYGDLNKDAPRQWNEKLTTALFENGFVQSKNDYSLYMKCKNGVFIAILVYVDDIVITGNNEHEIDKFKRKYCLELLCEYGLFACKPAATPLPDISYDVHFLSQHMHTPLQSHFTVALRVLRYLKNAPGTGVQFYKGKNLSLHEYSDADWAKCPKTRKSIFGFCLYLCNNLVSWKSKKQATISRSSAESEYRCLTSTTCELIWVVKILKDLEVNGLLPTYLYCDSSSAIQIATNPVFHEKTKHLRLIFIWLETKFHLVLLRL